MKHILFILTLFMKTNVFSQSISFSRGFEIDFKLEYLSYKKTNQISVNPAVNDENIWVRGKSYGISYQKQDNIRQKPLAFINNIGGNELYLGKPSDFYSRLIEELHPLTSKCKSLDLRHSRLSHAFFDLRSIFPLLNNLFLSSDTLSDTLLKQLIFPDNLRTLILEGYNIHQDFFNFLEDSKSLKTIVLINCWRDKIILPPHMMRDEENHKSSFHKVSKNLEYLVLIESSEMLFLDILHSEFPDLKGIHIDVNFDHLYGPHYWLNGMGRNKTNFPSLQTVFISMNFLDDVNFHRFEKNIEERAITKLWKLEEHEITSGRLVGWILNSSEPY
jgi:hypothetical protein